jgi:cell division protein YceG involved in septum cleavage
MRIKISPTKISNFLKKHYYWILGVIFFLLLCLNAFIYYQYVYLTVNTQPEAINREVAIDEETLNKIMENISEREENLSRVRTTKYSNPFDD